MWGTGNVVGFFPISNQNLAVWGTFKPPPGVPKTFYETAPTQAFLDEFKSFSGPWTTIAEHLKEKTSVFVKYPVSTRVQSGPVYHRIALIGQARLGISPLLRGHDLAQALEDSVTAADCIAYAPLDLDFALPKYASVRNARSEEIYKMGSSATIAAHTETGDFRMRVKYFLTKFDNGTKRLMEKESRMIGIDVNKKSIEILKEPDENKQQEDLWLLRKRKGTIV